MALAVAAEAVHAAAVQEGVWRAGARWRWLALAAAAVERQRLRAVRVCSARAPTAGAAPPRPWAPLTAAWA